MHRHNLVIYYLKPWSMCVLSETMLADYLFIRSAINIYGRLFEVAHTGVAHIL